MKFEDFLKIIAAAETYYPKANVFPKDDAGLQLWFNELEEFDYDTMKQGLRDYARTNEFPPRLCHFIDFAMAADEAEYLEPEQAWSMAYKAMCNSSYHAFEEFDSLPEEIQEAVGSPWALKEMARTDMDTLNKVDKVNFLISYKDIIKKKKGMSRKTFATQSHIDVLNAESPKGQFGQMIEGAAARVSPLEMPENRFLEDRQQFVPQENKGMSESAREGLEAYVKETINMDYQRAVNLANYNAQQQRMDILLAGED